jgi:hypothetical protein
MIGHDCVRFRLGYNQASTFASFHTAGEAGHMDAKDLQAIAARDQLWSALRTLLPEIQKLAGGEFGNSERERQVTHVLARVVLAELDFRAGPTSE